MPGRPRRRSASCFIRERRTASARCTRARPPWTGWSRSRSAASRLHRRRRPVPGTTFASTLSIHPATWTLPPRWSARCACWTAPSLYLTQCTGCSRSRKKSGGRRISTVFREFVSSTRSTRWVRISNMPSIPSASASARSRWRFKFPLDKKISFAAWWT